MWNSLDVCPAHSKPTAKSTESGKSDDAFSQYVDIYGDWAIEEQLYLSAPSSLKRRLTLKSLETLLLIDKVLEDRKILNSVICLLEMNKIECVILPKCTLHADFMALIKVIKYLFKTNYVRKRVLYELLKILPRRCLQRS